MGRRAQIVGSSSGNTDQYSWSRAGHDGYRRQGVSRLERLVAIGCDGLHWICADCAFPVTPGLVGFLHLAPGLQVIGTRPLDNNSFELELRNEDTHRQLIFFGIRQVRVAEGWYCTGFGRRQKNGVIIFEAGDGPLVGWHLQPQSSTLVVDAVGRQLRVLDPESTTRFEWNFE